MEFKISTTEIAKRLHQFELERGPKSVIYRHKSVAGRFEELPEQVKADYIGTATAITKILAADELLTLDEVGRRIHESYRERNKATIIHSLNVDFEQLSQENKQKVLAQFKVGLIAVQEMAEAATKTAEEDKNKGKE